MQEKKGYVSFVLHAHLPFIHHPESDDYLEESWLYEAISETYIPLLTNFKKLVDNFTKKQIVWKIVKGDLVLNSKDKTKNITKRQYDKVLKMEG